MKTNSKTRRQFLTGTAQTMVALPFLPSLWPRAAWGQAIAKPTNFIAGWVPLGGYSNTDLYPTYTADIPLALTGQTIYSTNLRLSPELGSISKIYSAGLNPYLSKLNVFQGLDCPVGHTHGEATMLGQYRYERGLPNNPTLPDSATGTGYPMVPSIDQFLAYSPNFYKTTPVLRSVVGYGSNSIAYVVPNDPQSGLKSVSGPSTPLALFNDIRK